MLCHFACFFLSIDFFSKLTFVKKFCQEYHLEYQTVLIQIRPDVLSDLIRVKTVCKSYPQTTLAGKEFNMHVELSSEASHLGLDKQK